MSTDLGEEDTAFLGAIGAESDRDESWAINLTLQGTPVTLQLNTGAEVTVVSDKMWRDVGQPGLICPDRTLHGPDNHIIPTLGRFAGTFAHRDSQAESDVYIRCQETCQVTPRQTDHPSRWFDQASGELQPVAYISRPMTPTEKRYAQIEKEALAFTWACEHISDYLVGLCFHIYTDHKRLVPLFSTKSLEELPLCVQQFRMRMMHFDFTISHVPGKELTIADTLSRAPASSSPADMELEQEATAYVNSVVENFPATEQRLQEIRECQQADTTCQKIVKYCKSGWPEKGALPSDVKPFHTASSQLSVEHGVLLRG